MAGEAPRRAPLEESLAMPLPAVEQRVDVGAGAVLASVPDWWSRRAARAGLPRHWQDWRLALAPPPVAIDRPASVDPEAPPESLSEAYLATLDAPTRLREGRHYTPDMLARLLWDGVIAELEDPHRIIDPACGAGALLLPALRALVGEVPRVQAESALGGMSQRISGTDLDPIAVWLGNAVLAAELLPLWALVPEERRLRLPQLLTVGDGLLRLDDGVDAIVMNPPYGRIRLEPEERARWSDSLYGHANRYALFLHAAVDSLRPGGVLAAVVPTSFLGGAYYKRLREFLATNAPLGRLTFVDSRTGVFSGGVLQETCLAVFCKAADPRDVVCARISVNGASHVAALPSVRVQHEEGGRPWMLPRHPDDGSLVRAAGKLKRTLADYQWRAQTGPLVWNRHKQQISAEPADRAVPIVWAADIDGGSMHRDHRRDPQRWLAVRGRDEFMLLSEPALLVQRTTAPEQLRRLVAAQLDGAALAEWGGAVVVENHVNVLRCASEDGALPMDLLGRLLDTATFDRLYRCITGSVAVSAFELSSLPLPEERTIRQWANLDREALERAVARVYGGG